MDKLSDDEDNSWNEEVSISDGFDSQDADDYKDEYYGEEEEYGDESPVKVTKKPELGSKKAVTNANCTKKVDE